MTYCMDAGPSYHSYVGPILADHTVRRASDHVYNVGHAADIALQHTVRLQRPRCPKHAGRCCGICGCCLTAANAPTKSSATE